MPWLLLQPELLGPFFIIVGAVVLIGLSQTLTAQHGSTQTSGFWATIKSQLYLDQAAGWLARFTRYVVSRFAGAHLKTLAHWLRALGTVALGSFIAPAENAEAVEDALRSLFVHGDPKARRAAKQAQATATHGVRVATRAEAGVRRDAQALNRYKATTNPRVAHATHAVDVTLPRDIAGLRARDKALTDAQTKQGGAIRELEDGATKTWDWIRSHPFSAATAAFTGAVVFALSRLGYGFLRCSDWRKLGRSIKCSDANVLQDLLALATVTLASQVSLSEFVRAMQAIENEAVSEIHSFIGD